VREEGKGGEGGREGEGVVVKNRQNERRMLTRREGRGRGRREGVVGRA